MRVILRGTNRNALRPSRTNVHRFADAFQAVMEREGENGRQRGFFVVFGYSEDAKRECAAFHMRTGRIIRLRKGDGAGRSPYSPPYYERGLYNSLRQGRSTPAVPLVVLGLIP